MHRNISINSSGIGDVICGLYVVQALIEEGYSVDYFSTQPHWVKFFTEARHKPMRAVPIYKKVEELYADYEGELSQFAIRKDWYAQTIGEVDLIPKKPVLNGQFEQITEIPKEEGGYIVLLPYSNWHTREWNSLHWLGLELMIEKELGLRCVILGGPNDGTKMQQFSGMRYWGQSPEVVINLLYHAKAVVGNDSGLVHLAGIFHDKVMAIHSQVSGQRLFSATNIVSIMPDTACAGCGFKEERGYRWNCNHGCWALQSITPAQVFDSLNDLLYQEEVYLYQN